jgi:antitoxin VapB
MPWHVSLRQRLATATGEDVDTAVLKAIEERLARVARPLSAERQLEVEALFDRLASMPVRDARTPDEIIGYGPDGLPR